MAYSSSSPDTVTTFRLLQAAITGNLPALKRIVDRIDVEGDLAQTIGSIKDADGRNALHLATGAARMQVCQYLVEELKLDLNCKDGGFGETALHQAIMYERYSIAEYLLEHGADPNASTIRGRTALHYAAEIEPKQLVKLLLAKGAKTDLVADCGTPLQFAAFNGNKACAAILLENRADPNITAHGFYTPLLAAIKAESVECVDLLLKAGANPNTIDKKGLTPLAYATVQGFTKIIKRLLKGGADPNVPGMSGYTPVEIAASDGNIEDLMILFPATKPIPRIPDWSLAGLMKHMHSKDTTKEVNQSLKVDVSVAKSKGDEEFNKKNYFGAINWYTDAIEAGHVDADILSNRSACFACLSRGEFALNDALACIKVRPNWPKAHHRAGAAWMLLKNFSKAADAFYYGWKLDFEDKELEHSFWEAMDALKNHRTPDYGIVYSCGR